MVGVQEWINIHLYKWAARPPPELEINQLRDFLSARKRYPCPPHLKEPILFLAKGANEITEWVCYEHSHWEASTGTFGCALKYFISKANENRSVAGQPGQVIKEDIDETAKSAISWFYRDLREQWEMKQDPDYEETDEPT